VNINTSKGWSAMDMTDLENDVRLGIPIEVIAEPLFLLIWCRSGSCQTGPTGVS
jgi:hypothetical protein